MSANHGNTPAAWTAVVVALVGFVVGGVGLMLDPVNMTVFWVGVGAHGGRGRRVRGDGQAGPPRPPHGLSRTRPARRVATAGRWQRVAAPAAAPSAAWPRPRSRCTCATRTTQDSWGFCPSAALGFYVPGLRRPAGGQRPDHGDVGAARVEQPAARRGAPVRVVAWALGVALARHPATSRGAGSTTGPCCAVVLAFTVRATCLGPGSRPEAAPRCSAVLSRCVAMPWIDSTMPMMPQMSRPRRLAALRRAGDLGRACPG